MLYHQYFIKKIQVVGILLILFFLISWLSRHAFLWTQRGIVPGAGWLDIHFNVPLRTITSLSLLILIIQLIPLNYPRKKDCICIHNHFLYNFRCSRDFTNSIFPVDYCKAEGIKSRKTLLRSINKIYKTGFPA